LRYQNKINDVKTLVMLMVFLEQTRGRPWPSLRTGTTLVTPAFCY